MGVMMGIRNAIGLGNTWPPPEHAAVWDEVSLFDAFRRSDSTRLRQETSLAWNERYLISPVPRLISRASANLLFGEPPVITTEDSDQANLDHIVAENNLAAELHRAAVIASSEGEAWGRVSVEPDLIDAPIIEFVSRSRVIPHFRGRFVVGATFVTEWAESARERVRLFEIYEAGLVTSKLYRGTTTALGTEIKLEAYERTKGREERVLTGVDWPLVTFVPNSIDADPTRGYSDYAGLQERFYALNEATTIGAGNQRLAGKKRAMLDLGYVKDGETTPYWGDDVFVKTSRQGGDDTQKNAPMQILEYTYEATQTIAWIDHLIDTTLSFSGIAPQSVGRGVEGGAVSGTALKLKMSHSLMESAGKGRYMDRGVKRLLRAAQIIDSRPTTEGGFGRKWADPDSSPAIKRASGLPRDDLEAAQQLTAWTAADSISLEERVRFLHPDWSQVEIDEEVGAVRAETGLEMEAPRREA